VNKLLVEAGLARAYFLKSQKSDPLRLDYEHAQDAAQSAHKCIWK
jgi:endonuclease YncB( thermonuclease family)